MVELYIEGRKVDLKTDVKVALNFTNTEVEYPTVIKNSFSTTVKVEGTKTNNEIFGDIWKLDRVICGNSTIPIGTNFDATKRVNFQLIDNGDVIEDGYLQLTNINYTKGMIEYSLVLYGGLGDFFYTLSYGDTDNEKTLEDLHFGWRDTLEEENTKVLGNWNRDFIISCWSKLEDNYLTMGDLESDITPIPTYNGLYEDFDNNKCMVDMTSGYIPYLQSEYRNDNKTYKLYDERYGLVEMPREIVEWEARDLRSNQQRFGIRMSTFFNAVFNPENNGGFNVVLDDEIKDSPYYKKSYIMFGKPNFEIEDIENDYEDPVILNPFSMNFQYNDFDQSTTFSPTQIELTNLGIPNVRLNMTLDSDFGGIGYKSQNSRNNWETRKEVYDNGFLETVCQYFWTGLLFRVEAYTTSGSYIGSTPSVLYSNNGVDGLSDRCYNRKWGSTDAGNFQTECLNQLLHSLNNDNEFKSKPITEIIYQNYEKGMLDSIPIEFNQNLPFIGQPAVLKMSAYWVYSQIDQLITGGGYNNEAYHGGLIKYGDNQYVNYGDQWFDATYIYEAKNWSGRARSITFNVLSGQVSKSGQVRSLVFPITKKKLFGGTKSPYKYLVDFTKMFGLKYRYDRYTRTIYIEKRRNYYTGEVKSLDVDLTKGVSITPTTAQSKWYSLELETPESYASLLYNRTNAVTYGNKLFGVDYEFNNDNTNLVEGNIYKNILPYRLSSYYFKPNAGMPSFLLSPSIKYSLYNEDEGLYTVDISNQWNQIKDDYGTSYQDTSTRMCLFNADNKYMSDIDNSLVFFNGFEKNKNFIISDNIKEMFDMNEKPCYLFTRNPQIAIQNPNIPVFTKYSENYIENVGSFDASFDFTVPNQIFGYEGVKYNENSTIYNAFWKDYLDDLYDKNTKLVTLNAFLQNNPIEEMRDFYYFDGCYWVISKIFDYVIGGYEPTKVELVKVNDVKNYKDEYVSPVHVISLRVEPNRPYIIPASGGFISPETLNIPVRAYYSDGTSKVVTNYNITGNTVYGGNLGKEITQMREIGVINFTVTYGGVSASGSVTVMQEANEMTENTTRNFGESEHVTHTSTESETSYIPLDVTNAGSKYVGSSAGVFNLVIDPSSAYTIISSVTYEYESWYEVEIRTTGYLWTSGASEIVTDEINTGNEQFGPKREISRSEQKTRSTIYHTSYSDSGNMSIYFYKTGENSYNVSYDANTTTVERHGWLEVWDDSMEYKFMIDIIQAAATQQVENTYYLDFYANGYSGASCYTTYEFKTYAILKCVQDNNFNRQIPYSYFTKSNVSDGLIIDYEGSFNYLISFNKVGQLSFTLSWDNNDIMNYAGVTGKWYGDETKTFTYNVRIRPESIIQSYGNIDWVGSKGVTSGTKYNYGKMWLEEYTTEGIIPIYYPESHYKSNDIVDRLLLYVEANVTNATNLTEFDVLRKDMFSMEFLEFEGEVDINNYVKNMKPIGFSFNTSDNTLFDKVKNDQLFAGDNNGHFYIVYEIGPEYKNKYLEYCDTVLNDDYGHRVNLIMRVHMGDERSENVMYYFAFDVKGSRIYMRGIIELVGRGTDIYDYGHFYRLPEYEDYITIPKSHYQNNLNVDKLYIYVRHSSGYDTSLTNTQFTINLRDMLTHKYNDTLDYKFTQPITASYLSLELNSPLKKELTYSELSSNNGGFYAVYEFNATEKNFILSVVSKYQDIAEVNSVEFPVTFTVPGDGTYSGTFTYEGKIREGEPNMIS